MTAWSDDDALWQAMAPALASPQRYALAESDAAAIARSLALAPAAALLDHGCGAGVHAVAFAALGFAVTGLDRTAALLRIAREAAEARGVRVELVRDDVRSFVRPAAFDAACSLYASFGYFDDATNQRVLENVRRSLRAGGALLVDVVGREIATAVQGEYEIAGTRYAVDRRVAGAHLVEEWRVGEQLFQTSQRLYTAAELADVLRAAGFGEVAMAGAFDLATPYDERAKRLVARARAED